MDEREKEKAGIKGKIVLFAVRDDDSGNLLSLSLPILTRDTVTLNAWEDVGLQSPRVIVNLQGIEKKCSLSRVVH